MSRDEAWKQAERMLGIGDTERAALIYESLTFVQPYAPFAALRLSLIRSRQGKLREATRFGLLAYELRKDDAELLSMLAKRLFSLGEIEHAIQCAASPIVVSSQEPSITAELGKLMVDAFQPTLAMQLLRRAMSRGLNTPAVMYLAGLCQMYMGNEREAVTYLLECLRMVPGYARAYWVLAKIGRKGSQRGEIIDALRRAIGVATTRGDAFLLHYALFKMLDIPGNEAAAWESLSEGMAIRRSMIAYDEADEQLLFRMLMEKNPAEKASAGIGDDAVGQPIFIVGMPRTGTTLLEALLARHPLVASGGELNDFVSQLRWEADLAGGVFLDASLALALKTADFSRVGRRYLEHTRWRANGAAFFTDKMPANFLNVGYILDSLPESKVIHISRNCVDTCFSNLKEPFFGAYPHSYDQLEMARHYKRYVALMEHWRMQYHERILDVSYENLVHDPITVISGAASFCGLTFPDETAFEGQFSGEMTTASAVQVREGINTRYIGQARRYEKFLGKTIEELGVCL
ncbi:tetratricopeptide repeat-containing sulfotransferase family protein [Pseudoxanthomonas beigongshangi]